MKRALVGKPEVLRALESAVASEAHLNAQYRVDWRAAKFMGLRKVKGWLHKFGGHAHQWLKKVTDRTLLLGGSIAYEMEAIAEPDTLTALLQNELDLEMAIVGPYEAAIGVCAKALDDTSRNLFEHLLKWHQKHIGWLEQQLTLIDGLAKDTGESRYISEKI
jgi:bacterioferritin (cytochrome b1)